MPSLLKCSQIIGCSRDALNIRKSRWNLEPPYEPEQFASWVLKPIDEKQANALSLEEARAIDTELASDLKRLAIAEKENKLIEWTELLEIMNPRIANVANIIRQSTMTDEAKERCLDEISDVNGKLAEKMGE